MATVRKTPQADEAKTALNIYQKLHLAKQSMGKVIKNATNPHLKRNYADINSIIDTVEPILLDHGLLLIQPIIDEKVCTIIVDVETGDKIDCYLTLPPITDAQKLGGAITYFRRYTLVSVLSLQAVMMMVMRQAEHPRQSQHWMLTSSLRHLKLFKRVDTPLKS
jgi:hypothetical protein